MDVDSDSEAVRIGVLQRGPQSSAFDLQKTVWLGRPSIEDVECERILCKWAPGAEG
jgi:hypothetical protein